MVQQNKDSAHISSLKWTETCINFCTQLPQVIEINPLKAELNPIRYLLALLGAHHIFHVSGIRVKVKQLQSKRVPLNPCLFRLYLIHAPCFIMPCEMTGWKWVAASSKHEAVSVYMFSPLRSVFTSSERYFAAASWQPI